MQIKVMKLSDAAAMPSRGSAFAAGYDLRACLEEDAVIAPHSTCVIGTGLAMEIPEGYFGGIFARSGLASKKGLRPANCVGVIDSDYRGEIRVAVHNDSDKERTVESGERIAQILILPFLPAEFMLTDSLSGTERGEGGFGSTGIR